MSYKKGEFVWCKGVRGEMNKEKITNIKYKFDEDTGEKYQVVCINDREYDGRTGEAKIPPYAYWIEKIKKTKPVKKEVKTFDKFVEEMFGEEIK